MTLNTIKHFKKSNQAVPVWEINPELAHPYPSAVFEEYSWLVAEGYAVVDINNKTPSSSSSLNKRTILLLLLGIILFLLLSNASVTEIGDYLDIIAWTLYLGLFGVILLASMF